MVELSHQHRKTPRRVAPFATLAVLVMAAACAGPASYETDSLSNHHDSVVALGFSGWQTTPPSNGGPIPTTANGADSPLSSQQQRQLQIFSQIVLNPSAEITSETRRNAAQELLAMDMPEAHDVLAQALRSGKPLLMQAAISAMQAAPTPVAALMDSAIAALATAPASVVESLSWVVARYGETARSLVSLQALDKSATVANRLGPIAALSSFDSQKAAADLMRLAADADEQPEIIAAACEGLQRISGLSSGTDLAAWRSWWKEASALPPGQWSAFITKSLSKRAAQLQQDLQKQREINDRISRELFAAYRDLYPSLPADEQVRRLPALLQDQLVPVREFAMSRISLLLRDSVPIPIDLQHKLAERLGDDSPNLRIQAARLLDELNYEALCPLLASRLGAESSAQVLTANMDILVRRPCVEAVEPARSRLPDPTFANRAAQILWRAMENNLIPADQHALLRDDLQRALTMMESPALTRLLAWIGHEIDVAELTNRLDDDDVEQRAAVAEGFAKRGLRQPLIDRVDDAVIFPHAVRAVADGSGDLSAFAMMAGWKPLEQLKDVWIEGLTKLATKLPNDQLLAADDVLVGTANGVTTIRILLLSKASSLTREHLTADARRTVIQRLAPLLIETGEAARAFGLLDGVNCQQLEWQSICFRASALSGHFDRAVEVQNDSAAWVALLAEAAQRDLATAAPLCQEIARRFEGRLTPRDQTIVDDVSQRLRELSAASADAS